MAFTEKYVTVAGAGAHDGSSESNAWTFAEMITAAPAAGTRVNMKAGSYSIGATTLPSSGTLAAPIVIRGYNSTIGDLDNLGRDSAGKLITTDMPDLTVITSSLIPSPNCFLQNLDITGALSSGLVASSANDSFGLISCRIVNTQNNASARAVLGDNAVRLINCDFENTGAAHNIVVELGTGAAITACRFKGASASALLAMDNGAVSKCVFHGNASNIGISILAGSLVSPIDSNTFYNLTTAIQFPNVVNASVYVVLNNHVTDCSKFIDSLYAGTATVGAIVANNRTRDVTTLLAGVEAIEFGAVTTDTGNADTDFTDVSTGDFSLISGAPGVGTGIPTRTSIGALQRSQTGESNDIRAGSISNLSRIIFNSVLFLFTLIKPS